MAASSPGRLFVLSLREPSEIHAVEPMDDGFLIRPQEGREQGFNTLAQRIMDRYDVCLALPCYDDFGEYESLLVLPVAP